MAETWENAVKSCKFDLPLQLMGMFHFFLIQPGHPEWRKSASENGK